MHTHSDSPTIDQPALAAIMDLESSAEGLCHSTNAIAT